MKHKTTHDENLVALKRIEGQVRGVGKMIEEGKYCVDIVVQVQAAIHALYRVSDAIFTKHLEHCVVDALRGKSEKEKLRKIDEVMDIIKRLHKLR